MSRTKHKKDLSSRPHTKGSGSLGGYFGRYFRPLLFVVAPLWPCPEFGECRFQLVIGACELVSTFEYSRRLHTVGNGPFWQSDEPKPCLLTARVGRTLTRKTLSKDRCDDILDILYKMAHSEAVQKVEPTDVFNCNASIAGRLTAVHPEVSFYDGNWHPLTREAYTIEAYKDCKVQSSENLSESTVVCDGLFGDERNWLVDYLVKLNWSLSTEPLNAKKSDGRTLILAPGDRMKGL